MIALDRDPTEDIHALRTISWVMKGGEVVRDDAETNELVRTLQR
jgi:hypothetical protein